MMNIILEVTTLKEKIERFSHGDFEYELPLICLSEEEISLTVTAGKIHEGSFTLSNSAGKRMKGTIYSSNRLMKLQESTFQDITNTIFYQFNALSLKNGDEIHGEINIVSEIGEVSLPFTVQIEDPYCMSSMGKIKDLFQFTNLARMDWSDAKSVFRSEDFERVFLANEVRYQSIYRNLRKSISTSQALEEFLVTIKKKAAIHLDIDKTQVEYHMSNEKSSDKVTLTKNQWGYAEIRVSTDASFIQIDQKFLWSDRFIGNTHQIAYAIDPQFLTVGNNFGHIFIKTAHQTLTVSVVCKLSKTEHRDSKRRYQQKIEVGLMDTYLSFRLNRIKLPEYIDDTEAIITRLPGPEVSYVRDLMKTYLAIIAGRDKLAKELLSDFSKDEVILKKKSILEYCAYLYLEALNCKDETIITNAAETIRKFYNSGSYDWRILWFLLYTDKRYERNRGIKLADIKEQFDRGCHSPIMYYEAVCIFNEEPYLLRELSDFEIQVLNYGIKNWIVSRETAKQYTYLAGKRKSFDLIIFNGLVKLYDEFDDTEILSAICCMLIKGIKKEEKYFEWYRLGVETQLRITELYEYYICCAGESIQDNLSQAVLLYFLYNSNLSDNRKAYLYAGVIKNKDTDVSIYRSYDRKMEIFALKMLESHTISRDLAILYQDILSKPLLSKEVYEHLPYVLYRHELICHNSNIVSAIVIHKELKTEDIVPLTLGRAEVDIYSGNAEIFLVDSYGNRYIESIDYSLNPYLNAADYENNCAEYTNHPKVLLHLFDRYHSYRILSSSAIELRKKVLLIEGMSEEYATYCRQTLIEYYYENPEDEMLEYYLGHLDLNAVSLKERPKYIEIMLVRAFYLKALEALEAYGLEGIPINRLVKLCSIWIRTSASEKKQNYMLNLCHYVFSNDKYDEFILRYLIDFYHGTISEMYRLWQAAQGFELECHNLEERLLSQMLYTESYMEDSFLVFNTYYKAVTNHLLVKAFLTYYAYRYLVHGQQLDNGLFQIMKRELFYEENDCCLLAWLKYHATEKDLSENELTFAEYNIQRLVRKGVVLAFFLDYKNCITLPDRIADKYIVSCHANPQKRIFIHYRLLHESKDELITECMNNSFMGIYTKEFLLFYHEELQYQITEESDEEILATENFSILYDCKAIPQDESNYNNINMMLCAMEKKNDKILLELVANYAKKEYIVSQCFKPIG